MPSDAFIGILTGLGSAHRERQKNIFDQEVERRSKYEQFLQKASTDPAYRPEAQDQFANLYTTLLQTPYEKKLPKNFERQVTDAVTSVKDQVDLAQGGLQTVPGANPILSQPQTVQPPAPFQGQVPARFSADEKFAEAMRLLNAQLQARGQSEIETEKAKLVMQPPKSGEFGVEQGLYRTNPQTGEIEIIREPQQKTFKDFAPPADVGKYEYYAAAERKAGRTPLTPMEFWKQEANFRPGQPPAPVVIQTGTGPQLVDRRAGTASPITSGGDVVGLTPTADQRNREVALRRIDPVLTSISELSEKINTGQGLLAKLSGGVERAKAQANYNDDVSEYEALISGFTPMVARAVGHTGVLTQQDVDSVRELFPKPGDSKTLRDRKIARVKTILGAAAGSTPPPSTGGSERREQFSKSTNQYRHTLDGGKTWRSGRLPK